MVAEKYRIICSNQSNLWLPEPTWLASPRMRAIHYVIKNQEVCLKPFNTPAKSRRKKYFIIG
nr:hypothetical protein Iba_chr03eCG0570 [Ipomoea batatas]